MLARLVLSNVLCSHNRFWRRHWTRW